MESKIVSVETVDAVEDKIWVEDLMKGPNGGVVISDVMKNQETLSTDMAVSLVSFICYVKLITLIIKQRLFKYIKIILSIHI